MNANCVKVLYVPEGNHPPLEGEFEGGKNLFYYCVAMQGRFSLACPDFPKEQNLKFFADGVEIKDAQFDTVVPAGTTLRME